MNISHKKKRWISLGVGIIGIITIVGLSDLMFLIPREDPTQAYSPQQTLPPIVSTSTTTASSSDVVVDPANTTLPISIPLSQ